MGFTQHLGVKQTSRLGPTCCSNLTIMTASFSYGVLHSSESICLHFYLTLPSPLGGRNYSPTLQMRETQGSDIQHCPRPQCGPGTQTPPFAFQVFLPLAIVLAPLCIGRTLGESPRPLHFSSLNCVTTAWI